MGHRAARLDHAALVEDVYRSYWPRLVRHISMMVGDPEEAADLAQKAFQRAVEHEDWASEIDLRRWLMVVATHLAIDEQRRRRRWGFFVRDPEPEWALEGDPDLWRALESLDPRVRAAFVLIAVEGYSQQEVADLLRVPRGTLASWLARARPVLQKAIGET